MPIVTRVGVDPLHFGVIMTVNLAIAFVTPPVGPNLFVSSAANNVRLEDMSREVWPMLACLVAVLIAVTYIPELSLFLTRSM